MSLTILFKKIIPFSLDKSFQKKEKDWAISFAKKLLISKEETKIKLRENSLFESVFNEFVREVNLPNFKLPIGQDYLQIFTRKFDAQLLTLFRTCDFVTKTRIENYLTKRVSYMLNLSKYRKVLPEEDRREDAFYIALISFFNKIKQDKNGFRGESALDAFFESIYYTSCIDEKRKKESKKYKLANGWEGIEEEYKALLSEKSFQKLRHHLSETDQMVLRQDLELLREEHPNCFHIIHQNAVMGFSYKEIAEQLNSTENSVKTTAGRCRKKLAITAKKLQLN